MFGNISRRGFLSSLTKASVVGLVGAKSFGGNQADETDWKTKWEEDYQDWSNSIVAHLRNEEDLNEAVARLQSIINERDKEILELEQLLYPPDSFYLPRDTSRDVDADETVVSRLEPMSGLAMIIRTGFADELINQRVQAQLDKAPWVFARIEDVAYVPEASDDQT